MVETSLDINMAMTLDHMKQKSINRKDIFLDCQIFYYIADGTKVMTGKNIN